MYLRGHGFPLRLVRGEAFTAARRFFEGHSAEEKAAAFPWGQENLQGYTPPFAESLSALSEEGSRERIAVIMTRR